MLFPPIGSTLTEITAKKGVFDETRLAKLEYPDNSLIIINFHGFRNRRKEHEVLSEYGKGVKNKFISTRGLFTKIAGNAKGKLHVLLNSCNSGYAYNLVQILPPGSTLMTSLGNSAPCCKNEETDHLLDRTLSLWRGDDLYPIEYLLGTGFSIACRLSGESAGYISSCIAVEDGVRAMLESDTHIAGQRRMLNSFLEDAKARDTSFSFPYRGFHSWVKRDCISDEAVHHFRMGYLVHSSLNTSYTGGVPIVEGFRSLGKLLPRYHYLTWNPIAMLGYNGAFGVLKRVIAQMEDPNIINVLGQTVVHECVIHSMLETLRILLSCKELNINIQDRIGNTALHYAVKGDDIKSVRLLLKRDDIILNLENRLGLTPLRTAIRNGDYQIMELLLAKGATFDMSNERDQSVLSIARHKCYSRAVRVLETAGMLGEGR